jgi:hypothetical protein
VKSNTQGIEVEFEILTMANLSESVHASFWWRVGWKSGGYLPMREVILHEACSAIRQMAEVRAHNSGVWKGGTGPFGTTLAGRQESKRRVSMELLEKNATGGLLVEQVETFFEGMVDGGLKEGMMKQGVVVVGRRG